MDADGKIVVAGYTNDDVSTNLLVARFDTFGDPDPNFNGIGYADDFPGDAHCGVHSARWQHRGCRGDYRSRLQPPDRARLSSSDISLTALPTRVSSLGGEVAGCDQ